MSEIKTYNKLVRDNIPDIIRSGGDSCEITVLNDVEFVKHLDMKLNEEVAEYQESKSAEEIADILEVLMAIAEARGYTWQEIMKIQLLKRSERGGFKKKFLLKSVTEV